MGDLLKNMFNRETIVPLIKDFEAVFPSFDTANFKKFVFDKNWESLELKERIHHIAVSLHKVLPKDYPAALKIIVKLAKERLPKRNASFVEIVLPDYVATYGLEHPDISLDALALLTPYPSSEFGVRPFIIQFPELSMKKFSVWCKSDNHHVRRFASEGCRPRLPWGQAITQFKKDPSPIMPIIEKLMNDPSEYVRKSAANSLNDISKDNPEIFISYLKKWYGKSKESDWILKHASRTLLKKGDKRVLDFFGYDKSDHVEITAFNLKPAKVKLGSDMSFSFTFRHSGTAPEKLRLEYKIYYVKSNGKLSGKIFKIAETIYEPGKDYTVSRRQKFKDMTTRKHYKGKHRISIVVNGVEAAEKEFVLA